MAVEAALGGSVGNAVAFGVAAELVYQVFGTTNSSPQTTEIAAPERAETMWKYVNLGGAQAVILVGIMAIHGRDSAGPILMGGAMALTFIYLMYRHARSSGLASGQQTARGFGG